LNCA